MLTSLQNPLIKQFRKLHKPKERNEQDLFLLEGTHLIAESTQVNYPLITVCCTQEWIDHNYKLWTKINFNCPRVEIVSQEVLKSIATTVEPDGIIAIAQRTGINRGILPIKNLGLVLETIQDPGNLGTIIRTSVATHTEGLYLSSDTTDIHNPKVLRSSVGQWFNLPMSVNKDLPEIIKTHQDQGMQIVATVPTAKLTLWDVDLTIPTLILLGNEGGGLSEELTSLTDLQVNIPLNPQVESLNVAIASALILYEVQRQRRNIDN